MRSLSRAVWALAALGVFLTTPIPTDAQTFQGGLRGAVRDNQGILPGATLTLINEGTGVTRHATANDTGEYSFPALDPGTYTLKASLKGFKTLERDANYGRVTAQANYSRTLHVTARYTS